ncbi:MAG: hypothetical protein WCE44_06845 [Candidatus Velthaea sp.]|jgi:hypothetical protein
MIRWPDGKKFAFTIIDDTDKAVLAGVKPFYDGLLHHGLRTTKTVWALESDPADPYWGECLQDASYLQWIRDLRSAGFEIAWHGARSGGADRATLRDALKLFRSRLEHSPVTYSNHSKNPECIYWGAERFDDPLLHAAYRRFSRAPKFLGSTKGSEYCWEDLCLETFRYVRDFTFSDVVTSRVDPWTPYIDPRRPAVQRWFSASDGADVEKFVRLLQSNRLDDLEKSGGFCIVYTHAMSGFCRDGKLDSRVEAIFKDLQSRTGWYVPVVELLDWVERERGERTISTAERRRLEWKWVLDRVRHDGLRRKSKGQYDLRLEPSP